MGQSSRLHEELFIFRPKVKANLTEQLRQRGRKGECNTSRKFTAGSQWRAFLLIKYGYMANKYRQLSHYLVITRLISQIIDRHCAQFMMSRTLTICRLWSNRRILSTTTTYDD